MLWRKQEFIHSHVRADTITSALTFVGQELKKAWGKKGILTAQYLSKVGLTSRMLSNSTIILG